MSCRIIGIIHGNKHKALTSVTIADGKHFRHVELTTDNEELDFIMGRLPSLYRVATVDEKILVDIATEQGLNFIQTTEGKVLLHQIKKVEDDLRLPCAYVGLRADDQVLMLRGSSGDILATAISVRLEKLGGKGQLCTINQKLFKAEREQADQKNEKDSDLLCRLFQTKPINFQVLCQRDRQTISLGQAFVNREDAMLAHQGARQRLASRVIQQLYLNQDLSEASCNLERIIQQAEEADPIITAFKKERDARDADLRKAVRSLPAWKKIFADIPGCGERISAGLLTAIGDISRFDNARKLKAYLGVHVLLDGSFPRNRRGKKSNWDKSGRQSLYLLGDQFNRQRDTHWKNMLITYKERLKHKHPEVVTEPDGRKKYTKGHIHKMATWKTLTKFVEFLYRELKKLDRELNDPTHK